MNELGRESSELAYVPPASLEREHKLLRGWRISRSLTFGLVAIAVIALIVCLGSLFVRYDPIAQDLDNRFQPPGLKHLLGTDNFGRDVLARILYAGRVDLQIGIIATLYTFLTGLLIGALAGFYGGWSDTILMRLLDVVLAFPTLVLVIGIVAMLGPGLLNMYIAIGLVGWVTYARLIRGEFLVAKNMEYVLAAKVMGCSDWRIIWRHVLPNAITPALTFAASDVVLNILFAASLGYLGLGVQPPNPEWGTMVAEGRSFLRTSPGLTLYPGLAIVMTGVSFGLLGDGLADYLRPGH